MVVTRKPETEIETDILSVSHVKHVCHVIPNKTEVTCVNTPDMTSLNDYLYSQSSFRNDINPNSRERI